MVRSCHAQCRASLEKAVSEGLISKNPSTGCKLPPKKGKEMKILSKNELGRFFVRAKEEGYYELFLLELSTGMRRGEIVGLKWSDFDEADGLLRITRQVNRVGGKTVVQSPKTKSSVRTVVLPQYMTEILSEMKKDAVCDWMFPSPVNIGEPRNPSALYKRFQLLLERSGCKQVRFHDLRHTFATMALENGMNIKILSDMIGHSSAETTLNIYSHVTDTMRTQASVKIDRKIGGTNAEMPNAQINAAEQFEPYVPKIRKSGTGCLYQVNENLWEGSFYPKMPNGKRKKFNVYAKTKEECEQALAEMIAEKKAEIANEKARIARA
jgi:integrase